jgi:uncharacterized protein YjbI with pentapeptide repeats
MLSTLRSRVTYPHVVSTLALFLALGTGGAYAANEWTGKNIVDGSLTTADYKNNDIRGADVRNADKPGGGLTGADVASGTLDGGHIADHSLGAAELAFNSVGQSEIETNGVGATEVEADSIDSDEVVNNGVTMADVKGADLAGTISVNAGIPDGTCDEVSVNTPGAEVGDAVLLSLRGAVDQGMLFYAVRVSSADHSIVKVCNFTGGPSPAVSGLPVRFFSFAP